ncbi:MAG: germination protein YpeB [Oscillospiraceae bacterium]|nr:germination protein YpeB [Oscillospiraceae bacterium]
MTKGIRIIAVIFAIVGVLTLSGVAVYQYDRAEDYERAVTVSYRHAFSELAGSVGNISSGLQKSLYAASPSLVSSICAEVYGEAKAARMIMGELPFYGELEHTANFLTTVGDYAFMLSKSAAAGEGYTEEQLGSLKQLSEVAEVLSYNLNQLMAELDRGEISIAALSSADNAAEGALQESMKVVESEFPEVPELIYDGPFSQHIETMKPLYLEGMDEVTKENAVKAVASLMELPSYSFAVSGVSEGNLPFYMIEAESEDKTVYAEVSVQGGVVLEIMVSRNVGEAAITQEEAVELAREFLEKAGYKSMRESYYMTNGNVCTVNFAYTQDGVVCYPDLIKVSVALDNGEIVGFETTGYVMSHTERALPNVSVSAEEAEEKVSDDLEVLAHNLAVIPTDGKYEVMCHEFKCETEDGSHCIVYVNAETGVEEKILILIESESGTLTK